MHTQWQSAESYLPQIARRLGTTTLPEAKEEKRRHEGEAVGETGTCGGATLHAVSWENGTVAPPLPDFGTGSEAFGINNQGQIVGTVVSANNTTQYGALWQNDTLTNLGILPGDFGGIASGINNKGQVVGSNFDSDFNWSHALIWQDNVMTDLNTLFPASSNLFAVMANKVNERGHISGMAIVRSGPDEGNIHAFLATPVNQSIGRSVAEIVQGLPKSNVPANRNHSSAEKHSVSLPASNPYPDGSYLLPLRETISAEWILHCSCAIPHASSQWSWNELKPYEVSSRGLTVWAMPG